MASAATQSLLESVLGEPVTNLRRLSGGASRETWSFEAGGRGLILRKDPPGSAKQGGMRMESQLLVAAAEAGVPVPGVVASGDDFIVMERIDGETIPRKILRDDEYAEARPRLAGQCGTVLAALHRIPVDAIDGLVVEDPVRHYRGVMDAIGEPHPTFEVAFRWLEDNRPPDAPVTVVHGDFRHGNLIIGPDGVRSVLDWELAHLGDPIEDLGWLCVKAWRFGSALPVGGFGTREDLVAAYEAAGGRKVDLVALRWWEVMGTLKWGIICIMQRSAHTSGLVRSVELAAIGRRVCENEWDLLELLS